MVIANDISAWDRMRIDIVIRTLHFVIISVLSNYELNSLINVFIILVG